MNKTNDPVCQGSPYTCICRVENLVPIRIGPACDTNAKASREHSHHLREACEMAKFGLTAANGRARTTKESHWREVNGVVMLGREEVRASTSSECFRVVLKKTG
jgi:hypothetical protein